MARNALHILDPERLPEFRKNALARAQAFDISVVLPRYEHLYDKVLDELNTPAN